MPIPSAALAGHRLLRERAETALARCEEATHVDFKQSASWEQLQVTIIKTVMAMSNQRDGGIIVVGVAEHGQSWTLTGLDEAHLASYDPDVMLARINRFASPPLQVTVVCLDYEAKRFLLIGVPEFSDSPTICQRNGDKGLTEGAVFVRPPGTPRSERPANASEMRDLLDLAAEKRARKVIEMASRIGFIPPTPAAREFDHELEGL